MATASLVSQGLDPDTLTYEGGLTYNAADAQDKRWQDLWAAGQGLQTIRAVTPVADVVDQLEREFDAAATRFGLIAAPRHSAGTTT